ncbi:MAG: hypothetical protein KKF46_04310 [Nanoarchaeota archaeon]|nr:hypothetical protein [Nanoarchaeota archaeon]MBU1321559.1 hypothetical protein [Nanoarchaeota archaeon]MBU1597093.1 hypothetical protein [Nanoarchaeota archaeon]MBU2441874.1 hypothetical protein [Nanoarchaeota archaeon]
MINPNPAEKTENLENMLAEKKPSLAKRIHNATKDYFNYKMAFIGAAVMGPYVAISNLKYTLTDAIQSGLTQVGYTFLMAGASTKACEHFAKKYDNTVLSLLMGTIVPTAMTTTGTFLTHSLMRNKNPLRTAGYVAGASLVSFPFIAYSKRYPDKIKKLKDKIKSYRNSPN